MAMSSSPPMRNQTARQRILDVLKAADEPLSSKDISSLARVSEKDLFQHLDHLRRSAKGEALRLDMVPAHCMACGFVFAKRERTTRPGRCPLCKSTRVSPALFLLNSS